MDQNNEINLWFDFEYAMHTVESISKGKIDDRWSITIPRTNIEEELIDQSVIDPSSIPCYDIRFIPAFVACV